jgi:hypothetical protein
MFYNVEIFFAYEDIRIMIIGVKAEMEFTLDSQHFPSGKDYACLRNDTDGTKTFLRNIGFLHAPRNPRKIVLVHEWEFPMATEWEPPKGQMEWKEMSAAGFRRGQRVGAEDLLAAMRDGVCREIAEEAKIPKTALHNLHVLPLSYSEAFKGAGAGAKLRYQFWTAEVTAATVAKAQKQLERIVGSPAVQASLAADKKEKDAVGFWEPKDAADWDKIRGGFSGTMTRMYYEWLDSRRGMAHRATRKVQKKKRMLY